MLSPELTANRTNGRHSSLEQQAGALADVLREEFGVPFAFFEPRSGAPVQVLGAAPAAGVFVADILTAQGLDRLLATGRAQVRPLPGGGHQLALPLYRGGRPVLVAVGAAGPLQDAAGGQALLERWAQAVADRMRLQDQLAARPPEDRPAPAAAAALPAEGLLALDHVVRRLRLRRDAHANCRCVLEAAFGLLGARALAWISQDEGPPPLVLGEDCLPPAAARRLAALLAGAAPNRPPAGPLLIDHFQEQYGAADLPEVHTLLALPVIDERLLGWVVALNKKGPAGNGNGRAAVPFGKGDATLLTPFAGLLELYHCWSARHHELKELLVGLTHALTSAIDAKDSHTFGHSERVARIAVELAREMGLGEDALGDVFLAGLLHDIGKIGVRDEVLRKPGKLTAEEEEHVRRHVLVGYAILADLRQVRSLLSGVLNHHERWDGTGYPDGLAGEDIPLLGRILAVADAYDAMTTARPYRASMPWDTVERILAEGAGTQWDPRVVEAFQRCRNKIHTIRQCGVGEALRAALEGALRSGQQAQRSLLSPADGPGR